MISIEQRGQIGSRMRTERARLGLTQKALAERIGSSRLTILSYESGKALPGTEMLLLLNQAGVDIQFVLTGDSRITVMKQRALFERAFLEISRQANEHQMKLTESEHLDKAWAVFDALYSAASLAKDPHEALVST